MSAGPSFSAIVKDELLRTEVRHEDCRHAECAALLQASGSLVLSGRQWHLRLTTELPALARRVYSYLKKNVQAPIELIVNRGSSVTARPSIAVDLSGQEEALDLMTRLGIFKNGQPLRTTPAFIRRSCCRRAYLRGMFLACGTIVQPEKAYHIEWVFKQSELAQSVQVFLLTMDISASLVERNKRFVVYTKDAESVSTVLAGMGAHNAVFALENTRIVRQMKNDVNRAVNCETANVTRAVDTAMRQIACLRFLRDNGILEQLDSALRDAAEARLNNPEANLSELAAEMEPPVAKSTMHRRLTKLENLAAESGFAG
ncbi:MAG: DNA-binding protein WhiA [Clostridia bacterium]|nr:DNA-binding protein WhiA [Clostridia bacterium]